MTELVCAAKVCVCMSVTRTVQFGGMCDDLMECGGTLVIGGSGDVGWYCA